MSQQSKPRIDFYKLKSQNRTRINRFCCQLADKVVKMGKPVFVRTKDEAESRLLDDIMWIFSDSSFLPHAIQGGTEDTDAPVIIGHSASASKGYLLINLSDELPEDTLNYERVAEIICDAPDNLQTGRARYSAYKRNAYPLHYHEITS
jgi:DNA polymerase-3 subunit chi